jgi:hypothetical protein
MRLRVKKGRHDGFYTKIQFSERELMYDTAQTTLGMVLCLAKELGGFSIHVPDFYVVGPKSLNSIIRNLRNDERFRP